MARFEILEPMWSLPGVGLAESMLRGQEWVDIDVQYLNKEGKREYPDTFWFDARRAKEFKPFDAKGVLLRLIPFSEMTTERPSCVSP